MEVYVLPLQRTSEWINIFTNILIYIISIGINTWIFVQIRYDFLRKAVVRARRN